MPLDSRIQTLNRVFKDKDAIDVVDHALTQLGQTSLVSSFGAKSVVLLHMAAQIDRDVPVLFIDTELMFPETLTYQQQVADALGLTNVQTIRATRAAVFEHDNENLLHLHDQDACCALRKTQPLQKALKGNDAWITGRKQVQDGEQAPLEVFELDRPLGDLPRIKVTPLAFWDHDDIATYMAQHRLPRHPLVAQGYPNVGCTPCSIRTNDGATPRSGRAFARDLPENNIRLKDGHQPLQAHAS